MRCKKCLKTFRSPPIEMRKDQICNDCKLKNELSSKEEKSIFCKKCNNGIPYPTNAQKKYQICHVCAKTMYPTKAEVKLGSKVQIKINHSDNQDDFVEGIVSKIVTSGDWHYEGLMVILDNGYRGRVKKVISDKIFGKKNELDNNKEIKNSAKWIIDESKIIQENDEIKFEEKDNTIENEIKELKIQQNQNSEKVIQIYEKVKKSKEEIQEIEKQIKFEKEQEKLYKGKGISKFLNTFSKKNKPLKEYTKKFLLEKNKELDIMNSEYCKNIFEQTKCRLEGEKIVKKIIELEEKSKNKEMYDYIQETKQITKKEKYRKNKEFERQMPKKKPDSLIEEAKKIKAELDELKRKKKFSDSYRVNTATQKQSGTCKGICKEFKAKRPVNGKRYELGQARCQICEIWIDYRGSHTKDSLPATEGSVGWYCNCCNYRVRQNPRNKVYKEKLRNNYKVIVQETSDQSSKLSIDKINRLISKSLKLIRKDHVGIFEKTLVEELKISEIEFEIILPKLLRLEDIVEKTEDWDGFSKKLLKSIVTKEIVQIKTKNNSQLTKIESIENISEIKNIVYKMVQEYIHHKNYISRKLKLELISVYLKYKSLSKIYEMYQNYTKEKIRRHIITDLRLPFEVKELENIGGLHPNFTCSITIALFATDYFKWDGEKENQKEILDLSISISKYLQSDEYMNKLFLGRK